MDSNVAELLSRAATQEPDKTILSEAATGRTITCNGLEELVQRVVQGLDDAGMVAGYRVMIATGNRIEFVAAYLGALRAGHGRRTREPAQRHRRADPHAGRLGHPDGDRGQRHDHLGPGGRRRAR